MRHMMKLLAVVSLLVCSSQLSAHGIPADAPPLAVLKITLGLTDKQVEDTAALMQERQAAIAPLAEELKAAKQELNEATNSDDPDPLQIGTLVLDVQSLQQDIAGTKADYDAQFEALLTDEQLTRLGNIISVGRAVRAAHALSEIGFH
ncbi:MAG: hypothetical protein DHS20C11_08180 [Lysobacteraceae bacterium]|nr:MAG: hypothetical protein DHS20C11_08180 [Xanthomonadaceae bacterium]